jgi:Putative MetA-pathway of phenol degradation
MSRDIRAAPRWHGWNATTLTTAADAPKVEAMTVRLLTIAFLATVSPRWANADDLDKSGYTLFDPTPDDLLRKFAPDRPTKGFSVRTIDAGHVEIETDLANTTISNSNGTTRSFQTLDPTLKLGLTNWMDFEVQFNGLQYAESFDGASPFNFRNATGFGDVFLRTKINLFGNDSGPMGFALIPYVKLPSSSSPLISNGAVEGGLIAPLALRPDDFIVTLMTEIDDLKSAFGNNRYANFVNLVSVSHAVPGTDGINAMVELYSSVGTDPATAPVYTLDFGMNFRLSRHVILDVGLNLGLNNAAPKAQVYTGISARF